MNIDFIKLLVMIIIIIIMLGLLFSLGIILHLYFIIRKRKKFSNMLDNFNK